MIIFVIILSLYLSTAMAALFFRRDQKRASYIGRDGILLGSIAGMIPVLWIMSTGQALAITIPWSVPFGMLTLRVDPLSAYFLLAIFVISALTSIYAVPYILSTVKPDKVGIFWFLFNGLIFSMTLVMLAGNAVLFLVAWEMMAWASFLLVIFEDKTKNVRKAGWIYLAATHIGFLIIILVFLILGGNKLSLDLPFTLKAGSLPNSLLIPPSGVFLLALIGFGFKAGFVPLHIWLPEAHPAAPSPVSALMSGVMIKTGIYGFLRILTFIGLPEIWWGWLLIALGIITSIWGIMFATAQHDFKRLLAYSSVENMGIILLGIGVGVLGMSLSLPLLSVLGLTAALFHIYNHAIGKSLLFLALGSVAHVTGTREIDQLGGLLKKMPLTGRCFLVGAVAMAGLPPLNGFMGELLLYLACFYGLTQNPMVAIPCLGVIACLAVLGTAATFCLSGLFGVIFLGEPRNLKKFPAHEVTKEMLIPQFCLAGLLLVMTLLAPLIVYLLAQPSALISGLSPKNVIASMAVGILALRWIIFTSVCLLALSGVLASIRYLLQNGRPCRETVTWDCGFASPSPRMQYTFSALMQPLTKFLQNPLGLHLELPVIHELFPRPERFSSQANDLIFKKIFREPYEILTQACLWFRRFQHGRLQFYILYIAITLLILLFWKLA